MAASALRLTAIACRICDDLVPAVKRGNGWLAEPKPVGRSGKQEQARLRRYGAASLREPNLVFDGVGGPPSPLRGYDATAFAWLAEPKLTLRVCKRERRLVDQNIASWNQVASWLKQLECLRRTAV